MLVIHCIACGPAKRFILFVPVLGTLLCFVLKTLIVGFSFLLVSSVSVFSQEKGPYQDVSRRGMMEDCLYLNIFVAQKTTDKRELEDNDDIQNRHCTFSI
jgi:hypothetical protein